MRTLSIHQQSDSVKSEIAAAALDNLGWGRQERVFAMIPGLVRAGFVRLGQMRRNTYIHFPWLLEPTMAFHSEEGLLFSGQISGTEGYVSPAASGYVAGANTAPVLRGQEPLVFPTATMIGALCWHVTTPQRVFQPMKPSFGLLPSLAKRVRNKRVRHQ